MCGEKASTRQVKVQAAGSPPRVRGEAFQAPCSLRHLRITPACAGRSSPRPAQTRQKRDHPRVCGEKAYDKRTSRAVRGSPPRVRGEVSVHQRALARAGITPACAGRSSGSMMLRCSVPDHPRVCGEKACRLMNTPSVTGSPPRVRGEVIESVEKCQLTLDHPRVCGEKQRTRKANLCQRGSPPRVRGED